MSRYVSLRSLYDILMSIYCSVMLRYKYHFNNIKMTDPRHDMVIQNRHKKIQCQDMEVYHQYRNIVQ